METLAFWLTIGLLLAHELDAVRCHEWRVLPLTSFLPEKTGEAVFLWAHIPLFMLVAWVVQQGADSGAALALSGFAIVHAGLHRLFRNHPAYAFKSLASRLLIVLPAVTGAGHAGISLLST